MAEATWYRVHDRLGLAVLVGLVGWFTAHFDTAFDHAALAPESTEYAWYAERAGRPAAAARIQARHALPPQQG